MFSFFQWPVLAVRRRLLGRGRRVLSHKLHEHGQLQFPDCDRIHGVPHQSRANRPLLPTGVPQGGDHVPGPVPGRGLRHAHVPVHDRVRLLRDAGLHPVVLGHDTAVPQLRSGGRPEYHARGAQDRHEWLLHGNGYGPVWDLGSVCGVRGHLCGRLPEAGQRPPDAQPESVHVLGATTTRVRGRESREFRGKLQFATRLTVHLQSGRRRGHYCGQLGRRLSGINETRVYF